MSMKDRMMGGRRHSAQRATYAEETSSGGGACKKGQTASKTGPTPESGDAGGRTGGEAAGLPLCKPCHARVDAPVLRTD